MKVLLIRLSSLGDVVLASSAAEALARHLPEAEIDFLTKKSFVSLFEGNPSVSSVISLEEGQGLMGLARELRANRYDWIVDLHSNLRTVGLKFLVRGPRWSTYRKDRVGRRLKTLRNAKGGAGDGSQQTLHVIDRYFASLKPLFLEAGVEAGGERVLPKLHPEEAQREKVLWLFGHEGIELDGAPLVALAPGARWATKAWPERHWRLLATGLKKRGAQVLFIGGGDEKELCERLAQDADGVSLAGKCLLMESAALLARCSLLVSNDSAPLHIATAVSTPVLALFGPTVEEFGFYPIGARDRVLSTDLECRPCHVHGGDVCPEGHHRCLEELDPVTVIESAAQMLEEGEER